MDSTQFLRSFTLSTDSAFLLQKFQDSFEIFKNLGFVYLSKLDKNYNPQFILFDLLQKSAQEKFEEVREKYPSAVIVFIGNYLTNLSLKGYTPKTTWIEYSEVLAINANKIVEKFKTAARAAVKKVCAMFVIKNQSVKSRLVHDIETEYPQHTLFDSEPDDYIKNIHRQLSNLRQKSNVIEVVCLFDSQCEIDGVTFNLDDIVESIRRLFSLDHRDPPKIVLIKNNLQSMRVNAHYADEILKIKQQVLYILNNLKNPESTQIDSEYFIHPHPNNSQYEL